MSRFDIFAQCVRVLFRQFFFKFFLKKLVIGKKIIVPCLGVKEIAVFVRTVLKGNTSFFGGTFILLQALNALDYLDEITEQESI